MRRCLNLFGRSLLVICILGNAPCMSQDSNRFTPLNIGDGLSHNTVYGIYQDSRGYLWFCTENGLDRWDGHRFRVYYHQPNQKQSLSHNNTNAIVEDNHGALWVATYGGGINRFDPRTESFEHYMAGPAEQGGLTSNYVQTLVCDSSGKLWVGSADAGLAILDPRTGQAQHFRHDPANMDSLGNDRIWAIVFDEADRAWVGTDRGLYKFNAHTGKASLFASPPNAAMPLQRTQVRCLLKTRRNRLWIGTRDGLASLDLITGRVRDHNDLLPAAMPREQRTINRLMEDSQGNLWVGLLFDGLLKINTRTGSVQHFRHHPLQPHTLSRDDVRVLFEDRSKNLWVGTRGGGLNRLDLKPAKFKHYAHRPDSLRSLAEGPVSAVASKSNGEVWVGSLFGGLSIMAPDRSGFRHATHDPNDSQSLSHNQIHDIVVNRHDKAWVATARGLNLEHDDGKFLQFFTGESGLPTNRIETLLLDHEDRLWAGTPVGLVRQIEQRRFESVPLILLDGSVLPRERVLALYEDRHHRIWVGISNAGLFRYDPGTGHVRNYRNQAHDFASLSNDNVLCIQSFQGALWLGTAGGGLCRFTPETGTFQRYLIRDGLPNNTVYGVLPDDQGYLWISTNRGLTRFDPISEVFRNYDALDGLQSNQFAADAYHRTSWGEMYFGGIGGLSGFHPNEVRDYTDPPQVLISSVNVAGRELLPMVTNDELLELTSDQNQLSFTMGASDYTRPEKNRYAYQLAGFEESWHRLEEHRSARYTNLPAGNYVFQVRAANHDGIWNETGASLPIHIQAPFFRDWWTALLATIFGALLLVALILFQRKKRLYRNQLNYLEQSEQLAHNASRAKSSFLANMSHELRTPLNAIIGYSEIMTEELADSKGKPLDPSQSLADLEKIKSSAYYQLSLVNNLIDLGKMDTGHGELHLETFVVADLVATVCSHMKPMLEKSGNRLDVKYSPPNPGAMTADRLKMEGILLNLVVNANRFTKRGHISLIVSRNRGTNSDTFCFKVRDTGIGLTPEMLATLFNDFSTGDPNRHEGAGLGLFISKHFSEMLGGHIEVDSQAGQGATFSVYVPAVVQRVEAKTDQ